MSRLFFCAALICFGVFLPLSPASAARFALLVGVADYPHAPRLHGPVHDVESLKELLVGTYDIPSGNITTLLNKQATKANILTSLSELKKRTQKGDFIFFYFSGHGTSTYEGGSSGEMDKTTGAIVPFDFEAVPANSLKTLERLIIGRRDLQPILSEMDRDRKLFVVFDSCYSGNAVRAIHTGQATPKFIPLDIPVDTANFNAIKELPFPYSSLVYIAAAHQTEMADDLPSEKTHDGRAHGALTDALLVGLRGNADLNHDGKITYEELYDYSRQKMQTVARHTPQMKSNQPLSNSVFERSIGAVPTESVNVGRLNPQLSVQVSGDSVARITNALSGLSGITLVTKSPDLRIIGSKSHVTIYLPSGDQLCKLNGIKELRERVERYAASRELLSLNNPRQSFNVYLRPLGDQGKSVFRQGEQFGVHITSEADANLLLINIDSQGYATLLLPNTVDNNVVDKQTPITLAGIGQVEAPFGVEYLKLFAFRTPLSGLTPYIGKSLDPVKPEYRQLLSIITRQQGWSSTTMEVVTME